MHGSERACAARYFPAYSVRADTSHSAIRRSSRRIDGGPKRVEYPITRGLLNAVAAGHSDYKAAAPEETAAPSLIARG